MNSSARNGLVGAGGVQELPTSALGGSRRENFSLTLGARTENNPFSGELAAIVYALRSLSPIRDRNVAVMTRNKAAMLVLGNPRQQSGQEYVQLIYKAIRELRTRGNRVAIVWFPASDDNELLKLARGQAREATKDGASPKGQFPRMRSRRSMLRSGI